MFSSANATISKQVSVFLQAEEKTQAQSATARAVLRAVEELALLPLRGDILILCLGLTFVE